MRFELLEEIDAALQRAEARVRQTLARLRDHDEEGGDPIERPARVEAAAAAVWALVVQHEACDCADHSALMERYRVPADVMARIGARE